jgi:hypothetical protein
VCPYVAQAGLELSQEPPAPAGIIGVNHHVQIGDRFDFRRCQFVTGNLTATSLALHLSSSDLLVPQVTNLIITEHL